MHTAVQYAEHRAPDRCGYHDAHTGRDDSRPSGRHNTVVVTPCLALLTENIDNNLIENAIRPLALGRKNYLFCGNDASAYRAAIVYSLIGTCKAAGVEPRLWMEDVLRRIPYYERDGRDMSDLLPREWARRKE